MDKPKELFHASQNRNIEIFEPRAESIRDKSEGPVVFATQYLPFASMFLANTDDSWTSKGQYNGQWYHAIADEKRFKKIDTGGAIYTLPSETFTTDLNKGMGKSEWISKVAVKPTSKKEYSSCLDAMLANDVIVIFIDEESFQKFRSSLRASRIKEAFDLLFSFPQVNSI